MFSKCVGFLVCSKIHFLEIYGAASIVPKFGYSHDMSPGSSPFFRHFKIATVDFMTSAL